MQKMNRMTVGVVVAHAVLPGIARAAVVVHDPIPVAFTTTDGVHIVGDYWTPIDMSAKAPAVILLHMYRSDRSAWHEQIIALEYAGFAIMAIDLRGHGDSTEPAAMKLADRVIERDASLFQAMHEDVAGAYAWLARRPEVDLSRLALIGASVGCSVVLDYAARDRSVDAVVLLSPGTKYLGVDSLAHIKRYGPRHILMCTSQEEAARGFDQLVQAAKQTGAIVEQGVFAHHRIHGTHMYGKVPDIDKRIAAFLKQHVNERQGTKVFAAIGGDRFYADTQAAKRDVKAGDVRILSSKEEALQRGLKPAAR